VEGDLGTQRIRQTLGRVGEDRVPTFRGPGIDFFLVFLGLGKSAFSAAYVKKRRMIE